jgi:4-hydroxybenzoate polyprenyltransferase
MRFKTSLLIAISSILGVWFYYSQNLVLLSHKDIFLKMTSVFLLILLSSGSLNLFNDIVDLKIDKELKPERILPQGLVSFKKAYLFFYLMIICCFILSIYLNELTGIIYLIMLFIGISYSLFLQNIPLIKNFVVAFSISMSILVGYISLITNKQFDISNKMIIILILSLFSILAFELQKDIDDVEIDKKFNKNTFPVIFGKITSARLVYFIYWIVIIIFWIYLLLFNLNTGIYFKLLLIFVQFYVLFSVRIILSNTSHFVLERARIRIYVLFAVTLIFLFIF